jgi:hypothetical protein
MESPGANNSASSKRGEASNGPAFLHGNCRLHTLIHTFSFEILLPHVVFILLEFVIKISAVDINFSVARKNFFILLSLHLIVLERAIHRVPV